MPTFRFSAEVTISLHAEIEAESEEEAREIVEAYEMPTLCYQCAGEQDEGHWSNTGEYDGEALNIRVEEIEE